MNYTADVSLQNGSLSASVLPTLMHMDLKGILSVGINTVCYSSNKYYKRFSERKIGSNCWLK